MEMVGVGGRRKVAHIQLCTTLIHCALAGAVKGSDERSDSSAASSDVAATPAPSDSSTAAEPAAAKTVDKNAEKAASHGRSEGGKGNKPPGDESGDAGQPSSTAASKKPFGECKGFLLGAVQNVRFSQNVHHFNRRLEDKKQKQFASI